MTFRSTPIEYLGKKAAYMHLVNELVGDRVEKFADFTLGSGTVPLYAVEALRARDVIVNDASPYSRLIGEALLVRPPMPERQIRRCVWPLPTEGFVFDSRASGAWARLSDEASRWIDGFCLTNRDAPLMLLALGCVLTSGAARFSQIVGKHMGDLTPAMLQQGVLKRALQLRLRQHGGKVLKAQITQSNYLDVPFTDEPWDRLDGRVMYLDPAWPTQPGHKTIDNGRAYGLYASTLMSVLLQRDMPMPPEYKVGELAFYEGMRRTIAGCLSAGAVMLVAYQTTEERVGVIREQLFGGMHVQQVSADKNAASTLREYLFRVEA